MLIRSVVTFGLLGAFALSSAACGGEVAVGTDAAMEDIAEGAHPFGWTRVAGPGGLDVFVPPGEDPSSITIDWASADSEADYVGAGPRFEIGPAGRQFSRPIIVATPLSPGAGAGWWPFLRYSTFVTDADQPTEEHFGIYSKYSNRVISASRHLSEFQAGVKSVNGSNPAPSGDVSGTWTGEFQISNDGIKFSTRQLTVELLQRADGRVFGYILGGTRHRTVLQGRLSEDTLDIDFEFFDAKLLRTFTITGTFNGTSITGEAQDQFGPPQTIVFSQITAPVQERRFYALAPESTADSEGLDIAVALDQQGEHISGSWVDGGGSNSFDDCAVLGCGGGTTRFIERANGDLDIWIETGGGCSDGSNIHVVPGSGAAAPQWLQDLFGNDVPSPIYVGTYSIGYPQGAGCTTKFGSIALAEFAGTHSPAVSTILGNLRDIADEVELRAGFDPAHMSIDPNYLHYGTNAAVLSSQLDKEASPDIDGVEIQLERVREISTDYSRDIGGGLGCACAVCPCDTIDFDDIRTAYYQCLPEGAREVVYRDTSAAGPDSGDGSFEFVNASGQLTGNHELVGMPLPGTRVPLDLPFHYTPALRTLKHEDPLSAHPVYISLGPHGAHNGPLTGHRNGDAKANLGGYLKVDCGSDCSVPKLDMENTRVIIRAPAAGTITKIHAYAYDGQGLYVGDPFSWGVTIELDANGLQFDVGHLSRIPRDSALHAAVLAETGVDLDPPSDPLVFPHPCAVRGDDDCLPYSVDLKRPDMSDIGIRVEKGDVIGDAQIQGNLVSGSYEKDGGSPWAQLEFAVDGAQLGRSCYYDWLPASRQTQLQAVMSADMLNPASPRYGSPNVPVVRWGGEAALCMSHSVMKPPPHPTLRSRALPGWFEKPVIGDTSADGDLRDEIVSIFPIDRTTAVFQAYPDLYDPRTQFLINRGRDGLGIHCGAKAPPGTYCFDWEIEDGTVYSSRRPVGEVISLSSCEMLIKWRELRVDVDVDLGVYQSAAYEFVPDPVIPGEQQEYSLRIKWGDFHSTESEAMSDTPTLTDVDECNVLARTQCFDHTMFGHF